jgi:hypothetical protein
MLCWCWIRWKSCKTTHAKKVSRKCDKKGVFMIPTKNFWKKQIMHFFANFKAKIGRNCSKKRKSILKMCLRIPLYIYFRFRGPHFVKKEKKSKLLYPTVHTSFLQVRSKERQTVVSDRTKFYCSSILRELSWSIVHSLLCCRISN